MLLPSQAGGPVRIVAAGTSVHMDRGWPSGCSAQQGDNTMLWTIAVILAVLWLLGMVSSYTLGGFIHVLLFLAVVALIIQLLQGRGASTI